MMPMFLTVYLSNNDHHFNEVPITPETLCRDVVELCKEPGEAECYLAEMWRGSERVIGDGERMLEVLQRWGQQRGEVRYLLRHQRPPGRDTGGPRAADQMMKRNQGKCSVDRCLENGVSAPRLDVTLSELQDLATRQQQQINAQQQLLASKEQRLRFLKLQDQRQQQQQEASEQERLRQLRENAHNQEAKLRRVRALRGQVEQKRLSNSKLVEEIEQMTGLFQQKQRELLVAVARVEELSDQLEALRSSRLEPPLPPPPLPHHHNTSSTAELERLYKELQLRNKLNQDQSVRLQQQRDSLNKRNLEVAAMDRRLAELRQRLWKKKAALQHKENLPVSSDGVVPQLGGGSRVAAVGPDIQSSSTSSSQAPPVSTHQEVLVKPAYPDGTATLPMPDSSLKPPPRPVKPASGFNTSKTTKVSEWSSSFPEASRIHIQSSTLPRMSNISCHKSGGETLSDQKFPSEVPPPVPSRTNHTSENLLRDNQASGKGLSKMLPLPLPSKPKPFSSSNPASFSRPSYSTGTFPGKVKPVGGHLRALSVASTHSNTLPLPSKQDSPPAVAVRPYTPDLSDGHPAVLQKPQTVAASSIYSMYTQQKSYQPGGGTLPRSQPRGHIPSSLGVILRTTDKIVWANEFEPIQLTCLIESISTNNPRIEWKKIKNGVPSYVYFQNKISGDLEHRAQLREPANILIFNTTRSDTAEYRCEVAAIDDQRSFDEILISLAVRVKPVVPRCSVPEAVTVGTSTELRCLENEGFPAPQYRWFHNSEELPQDPKNSPRFINSSYSISAT